MKIYTRTGDDGTTGILGPSRLGKDDPRIEAYGTVDELNAALGVVRADEDLPEWISSRLRSMQADLFSLGAALADPDPNGRFHHAIQPAHIDRLELLIDDSESRLPPLTQFILPGGTPAAAQLHLARTICRRAERRVIHLRRLQPSSVPPEVIVFLNRLSDLLFSWARATNAEADRDESPWLGLDNPTP